MDDYLPFIDKRGNPCILRNYSSRDFEQLSFMYDFFAPKARFQGMPPDEKIVRENWLKMLIRKGNNLLAWQEEKVVGHAVVLPDLIKRDAEYLIFVLQSHRGKGIGSALTRLAIEKAKKLDLKNIWLMVDAYNFRATRLYKKHGFLFSDIYRSASERMMLVTIG